MYMFRLYIINDIFPTSFLDLPKILKIPRSDGTIQDGFVKRIVV